MDKQLSQAFSALRFLLALLVVYIHIDSNCSLSFIEVSKFGGDIWTMSNHYFNIVISQTIARLAVPTFFFMSGYLFFVNFERFSFGTWSKKIKSRFHSLLIPYILWNIIAYVYFIMLKHQPISEEGLLAKIDFMFLHPADFPLWYVRDLMVLVCFTPVIYYLSKYLYGIAMLPIIIAYLFLPELSVGFLSYSSFFFFILGSFFCINGFSFCFFTFWIKKIIYAVAIGLGAFMIITYGKREEHLWALFLLIGVLAIILFLYNNRLNISKILVASSFFVYASHRIGVTGIAKSLFLWIPNEGCSQFVSYIIAPMLTYLICTLGYVILSKYVPSVFVLLNGRK